MGLFDDFARRLRERLSARLNARPRPFNRRCLRQGMDRILDYIVNLFFPVNSSGNNMSRG